MKKKCVIGLCGLLLVAAVLLLSRIPPISYDKSILLDHKASFEMAAAVCMEHYHQDAANDDSLMAVRVR